LGTRVGRAASKIIAPLLVSAVPGLAVTGCASGPSGPVSLAPSVASVTSSAVLPSASPSPSNQDERLHHVFFSPQWQAASPCLCSFRVDPAPATVTPRHTAAQMLSIFEQRDGWVGPGTSTTVRFGLFSGNKPLNGVPAGHQQVGARPVVDVPAWLIVVNGVEVASSGGGASRDMSPRALPSPRPGYALTVLGDRDGRDLTLLEESGPAGLQVG